MSFTKNCPQCGKEQIYKSEMILRGAIRKNAICLSCSKKGNKARLGMKHSQETKSKMSKAHKGKTLSSEHRKSLSLAHGGDGNLDKFNHGKLYTWSKEVRERDEYVCQHCNHDFYPHECHAHHILPKAKFPQYAYDLDNGITLCNECHKYEHKHYGRYR